MRNWQKYPLTVGEVCRVLDDLSAQIYSEGGVGDIRPLALKAASKIVLRLGFAENALKER